MRISTSICYIVYKKSGINIKCLKYEESQLLDQDQDRIKVGYDDSNKTVYYSLKKVFNSEMEIVMQSTNDIGYILKRVVEAIKKCY